MKRWIQGWALGRREIILALIVYVLMAAAILAFRAGDPRHSSGRAAGEPGSRGGADLHKVVKTP